jgi:hypothetical protein
MMVKTNKYKKEWHNAPSLKILYLNYETFPMESLQNLSEKGAGYTLHGVRSG